MPKISFSTVLSVLALGLLALLVGRYWYMQPGLDEGELAPGFESQLLSGEDFRLESLRGQYVLIDFWGSWCPPCRREHPELVRLYRTYAGANFEQAEGFTIVSVGIEQNRQRWERAIQQDGLRWPFHVYDEANSLRFFDAELSQLYGVNQVPVKYLLNPDGRIMAVNPSLNEVGELLSAATAN